MAGRTCIGRIGAVLAAVALAGCMAPAGGDHAPVQRPALPVFAGPVGPQPDPDQAIAVFAAVVARVEPLAEALCRHRAPQRNCDFLILVDDRPGQPVNAYQRLEPSGRPVIGFTAALIADARNAHELAFVLGHEAAHHIAGHIPRARDSALAGALIAGTLAALAGGEAGAIRTAQDMGAAVGARTYSKDFELEADALGAEIAYRAGYDAEIGAAFFGRLPDPGNRFLGTHPPNAARIETVRRALAALRAGRGIGVRPI